MGGQGWQFGSKPWFEVAGWVCRWLQPGTFSGSAKQLSHEWLGLLPLLDEVKTKQIIKRKLAVINVQLLLQGTTEHSKRKSLSSQLSCI